MTARRRLAVAAQAALWLLLIWFVVRSVGTLPGRAEIAAFARAGALEAVWAFAALFTAALLLRALRFGYLIRAAAPIGWGEILSAFPWLFMVGAVTPFRLGDVARADWVRRRGGSAAHTLGLWVAERVTDLLCLAALGLLGVALTPGAEPFRAALMVLAGVLVGVYGLLSLAPALPRRLVGGFGGDMLSGLGYMRRPRAHGAIVAFTLAIWAVMAAAFWIGLALALDRPVSLGMALLCMAFVNLAALISAAPGNVGSFQAAAILALGFHGVGAETAFLASSALQLAGLGTTLLLGLASRAASAVRAARRAPSPAGPPRRAPGPR